MAATGKASAKAAPASAELTFVLETETKGTHRFSETDSEFERAQTLYITKEWLEAHGMIGAKQIKVTVEAVDG